MFVTSYINKIIVYGHDPLLCYFYLKQRFGDWILSPTSGKSLLSWAQSIELVLISEHQRQHKIGYI
jgi:hypothetical protein